jgi:hypothetical protein
MCFIRHRNRKNLLFTSTWLHPQFFIWREGADFGKEVSVAHLFIWREGADFGKEVSVAHLFIWREGGRL